MIKRLPQYIRKYTFELSLLIVAVIFSSWLMFSTFSYKDGAMLIATKAWSDFASHIPLIRSFSFGSNFPPEYPLFPGEPIRYHFLFFLLVGLLEKAGLRIDYALNIPSILGFAALLTVIYVFAKYIFSSRAVAILSVVFFLFNGSLSFLYFLQSHPINYHFIQSIVTNNAFPSFGPYDQKIVSAFWNWNIYTNQRHLAASYAASLAILFFSLLPAIKNRHLKFSHSLILGVVLGGFFFFNMAVFLETAIALVVFFILFPRLRKSTFITLVLGAIIAFPQYHYMQQAPSTTPISFHPGYLVSPLTILNFLSYWFWNLGLHMILAPLGFLIANSKTKRIGVAFFSLFLIGNLFQFSVEIAANHKFFNFFMIVAVMFSAYFLVYLWKKFALSRVFVVMALFLLTFSGVIDAFPIINDAHLTLADYKTNPDIAWIMNNTPKNAVFLNTNYLYDPASLAGRKIFLGWPYFAWSQGYDTNKRGDQMKKLLSMGDKIQMCLMLKENNINYIDIEHPESNSDFAINWKFIESSFNIVYKSLDASKIIVETRQSCNQR